MYIFEGNFTMDDYFVSTTARSCPTNMLYTTTHHSHGFWHPTARRNMEMSVAHLHLKSWKRFRKTSCCVNAIRCHYSVQISRYDAQDTYGKV